MYYGINVTNGKIPLTLCAESLPSELAPPGLRIILFILFACRLPFLFVSFLPTAFPPDFGENTFFNCGKNSTSSSSSASFFPLPPFLSSGGSFCFSLPLPFVPRVLLFGRNLPDFSAAPRAVDESFGLAVAVLGRLSPFLGSILVLMIESDLR